MQEFLDGKTLIREVFDGRLGYVRLLAMAKTGKIPCIKIGGRLYFRRSSILDWLKTQENVSGR